MVLFICRLIYCELMDIKDLSEASLKAVELVSSKKADIVMKGLVDTSIVLKAVLNKEIGLRTGNVLSHTGVFAVEGYNRLFFITDAAMNIDPDLNTKKQIIEFNFVTSLSALEVKTIGAFAPNTNPALSAFAKKVIDL